MSRPYPLTAVKAGITRLLDKGGASRDSLYDLLNGYVNASRRMVIRPGSVIDNIIVGDTRGLAGFKGQLWVFSHTTVTMPSSLYRLAVLHHPTNPALTLVDVHLSTPFAGALYVVAEFSNGDIRHYWLEPTTTWKAGEVYNTRSLVEPVVANGYYYRPTRLGNVYPAWTPRAPRAVGDKVEPAVYNGFYYEVVSVTGANPTSGSVEPTWPTNDGQTVAEEVSAGVTVSSTPGASDPGTTGGTGGADGGYDPYDTCVAADSYLSPYVTAGDYLAGMLADLHTPERGYFRAQCERALPIVMSECVRITTESGAWLEVSATTPVNFSTATRDLEDGHWCYAPFLLGHPILVEESSEIVTAIDFVGMRPVKPLNFRGASFAASGARGGRRIYTHNIRKSP